MADYILQNVKGLSVADLPVMGARWEITTDPPLHRPDLPHQLLEKVTELMEMFAIGGFENVTLQFSDLSKERKRLERENA